MRTQLAQLRHDLENRTIKRVIQLSAEDQRIGCGWSGHEPAFALELSDGTYVSILRDPEGNGPGHLDVTTPPSPRKKL